MEGRGGVEGTEEATIGGRSASQVWHPWGRFGGPLVWSLAAFQLLQDEYPRCFLHQVIMEKTIASHTATGCHQPE